MLASRAGEKRPLADTDCEDVPVLKKTNGSFGDSAESGPSLTQTYSLTLGGDEVDIESVDTSSGENIERTHNGNPDSVDDLRFSDYKTIEAENTSESIFDQVEAVIKLLKKSNGNDEGIDPNEIYMLLEDNCHRPNPVKSVVEIIGIDKTSHAPSQEDRGDVTNPGKYNHLNKESAIEAGELNTDEDPLVKDMLAIAGLFPEMNRNEIYAYLEANYNEANRVEAVIEEILRLKNSTQSASLSLPHSGDIDDNCQINDDINTDNLDSESITKDVRAVSAMFPDCDPNYVFNALEQNKQPDRVEILVSEMLNTRSYPKLQDALEKQKMIKQRRKLQKLELSVEEFLQKFNEPLIYFYNEKTVMSTNYKAHCALQLRNIYPMLHVNFIDKILAKHNHHFTPTVRDLDSHVSHNIEDRKRKFEVFVAKNRHGSSPMPETADELFYHEVWFTEHEQDVKHYYEEKRQMRNRRICEAKEMGDLQECGCCFDDQVLFEEMSSCLDGHFFCNECIRRSSEVIIGESHSKFPCLSSECAKEFPLSVLQNVLAPGIFSNLLKRLQEEEIKQADIPDLVCCQHCSFATIMTDPSDKVFKCQNPECLKETCRLCNEPNHVPLRCEEVEKADETSKRTYIENEMTEAMLRTCGQCHKRFFKEEGCNKMTCNCGATMCYVCRKPNITYSHFVGKGKCPQDTDVWALHQKEMTSAGLQAKEDYDQKHPEAKGIQLKNDPFNILNTVGVTRSNQPVYDDEDDEDDYESGDGDEYDDSDEDSETMEGDDW